ncbi:hypothetical protein TNCV_3387271 [Trichonephila clavipes]|nr:hypothetical protein TNCV_3387271 [Trichonephila clavipes]
MNLAGVTTLFQAGHWLASPGLEPRRRKEKGKWTKSSVKNREEFLGYLGSTTPVFTKVAAIRNISRSCLDPNDFTVLNCIVKGHASLSLPSLWLRLCSGFTLLATYTYFDPKDFNAHPIDSVKGHASFSPLAQQKAKKKIKQKRSIDSQSRRKVFVNSAK